MNSWIPSVQQTWFVSSVSVNSTYQDERWSWTYHASQKSLYGGRFSQNFQTGFLETDWTYSGLQCVKIVAVIWPSLWHIGARCALSQFRANRFRNVEKTGHRTRTFGVRTSLSWPIASLLPIHCRCRRGNYMPRKAHLDRNYNCENKLIQTDSRSIPVAVGASRAFMLYDQFYSVPSGNSWEKCKLFSDETRSSISY